MSGFWTNRVANPVLRRVLRGPLGARLGRRLAVLRYTGVRTGRPHELVCQYARTGDVVWVLVGHHEQKTWWRNLRSPGDVDLWLAGRHVRARATAVVGADQPAEARVGLAAYVAQIPPAARALHLPATPDAAALDAAAGRVVLVRADVVRAPDAAG